jgi:ribosomal protein S18 acetylase RimI-like enzyme
VITYRTFLNSDTPRLVEIWNASLTGRGAAELQTPAWLEYFLFSKPYFDPAGLIVACEEERPVGFAQAGFAASDNEKALDRGVGIICLLAVHPTQQRKKIGSALLERCESYLRQHGAQQVLAGPLTPLNPFTFGLYGGCSSVGFLQSDAAAGPFLQQRGYQAVRSCLLFQHSLKQLPVVADGRFAAHRLRYEIHAGPTRCGSWWVECTVGPIELHEYRLVDKLTRRTVARLVAWEMETFSSRWQEHAIGVLRLEVQLELRRQGLAKFLLAQIMHHLHDQYFSMMEIPIAADNEPGLALLERLGFQQVDTGHHYRKV